jgi:hypothetical protein
MPPDVVVPLGDLTTSLESAGFQPIATFHYAPQAGFDTYQALLLSGDGQVAAEACINEIKVLGQRRLAPMIEMTSDLTNGALVLTNNGPPVTEPPSTPSVTISRFPSLCDPALILAAHLAVVRRSAARPKRLNVHPQRWSSYVQEIAERIVLGTSRGVEFSSDRTMCRLTRSAAMRIAIQGLPPLGTVRLWLGRRRSDRLLGELGIPG